MDKRVLSSLQHKDNDPRDDQWLGQRFMDNTAEIVTCNSLNPQLDIFESYRLISYDLYKLPGKQKQNIRVRFFQRSSLSNWLYLPAYI